MRAAVAILAVVLVFGLGFLYIGTTHRDRCLKAGNVGCTLLPWSGHAAPSHYLLRGWWNSP